MAIISETQEVGYVIQNQVQALSNCTWFKVENPFFNLVGTFDPKNRVNITMLEDGSALIESPFINDEIVFPIESHVCTGRVTNGVLYANGREFHNNVLTLRKIVNAFKIEYNSNYDCDVEIVGNIAYASKDSKFIGTINCAHSLACISIVKDGMIFFDGNFYSFNGIELFEDHAVELYQYRGKSMMFKLNGSFVAATTI